MRARAFVGIVVAFAGATGAIALGCSVYGPDLLTPSADANRDASITSDAGDDAASPEASPPDAACVLAHPPAAPSQDDPSDGGDIEIVLAVRTFDLGLDTDGGAPPTIGYDLDGLCTCPGAADCVPPSGGALACDQPSGRDNAGGALLRNFYNLSSGAFFSQDTLNAQIAAGLSTFILRVRNYNGTPNDTRVELSVYISDGIPAATDGGAPGIPAWDGEDSWSIDAKSVFGGSGPPIVPILYDMSAYVANGVLVGSLATDIVPLKLDMQDRLDLELTAGNVTGTLVNTNGQWSIADGVVDGRLSASNLLSEFTYLHDPATIAPTYICSSSATYQDLKPLVCGALDLSADPSAPSSATCDALSMALGFKAQSAQLGSVTSQARTTTCDGGSEHC